MTADEVVQAANISDLAGPDMKLRLGQMLRRKVVPEFFRDIERLAGSVFWRRRTTTISIVAPTRNYDLPADFEWMERVDLYSTAGSQYWPEFKYIGEDPEQVSLCEGTVSTSRPTGWYAVTGSAAPFAMRVNCIPDTTYTARCVYRLTIPWADDSSDVDLNPYIPQQNQWALVDRLKAEIYKDRFGMGDQRFTAAMADYGKTVAGVANQKEAAARNHVRRVT